MCQGLSIQRCFANSLDVGRMFFMVLSCFQRKPRWGAKKNWDRKCVLHWQEIQYSTNGKIDQAVVNDRDIDNGNQRLVNCQQSREDEARDRMAYGMGSKNIRGLLSLASQWLKKTLHRIKSVNVQYRAVCKHSLTRHVALPLVQGAVINRKIKLSKSRDGQTSCVVMEMLNIKASQYKKGKLHCGI